MQPPPRVFVRMDSDGTLFSVKTWCEDAVFFPVDPLVMDATVPDHSWSRLHAARPSTLFYSNWICTQAPKFLDTNHIFWLRPTFVSFPTFVVRQKLASRNPRFTSLQFRATWMHSLHSTNGWKKLIGMDSVWRDQAWMRATWYDTYSLEMPSQREKILPLLDGESRSRMEEILDRYKRTYKNKFRQTTSKGLGGKEPLYSGMDPLTLKKTDCRFLGRLCVFRSGSGRCCCQWCPCLC